MSIGAMLDDRFNPLGTYRSVSAILFCEEIRPAMSRRVVDDATRSPIAGATVIVESWLVKLPWHPFSMGPITISINRHLLQTIEVQTDAQGVWDVSQGGMWMPAVLGGEGGPPPVLWGYCVRADGYATLVVDPWKLWNEERRDDMISDVALHAAKGVVDTPDPTLSKCGLPLGPPL